jgi:integrase/recombinase XerD
MTLADYLEKHYTKKTAISYKRQIEIYKANNPGAKKYTYAEIVNYIGVLRGKYKNARTINGIVCSIKVYYSYLCFREERKDNPGKSIRLRDQQSRDIQLQDLFTREELERLLTAKQERYKNLDYRNKVLISLLIYQALKPTEIENLQTGDINLEEATIYIKASAKNNSRTLPLKANQILLFRTYLEEIRGKLLKENETDFFMIGQRRKPMTGEDITQHMKGNYQLFKPRKVNAMTIRQSVITNLLKQNNDLRIVQSFAGHKYPSSTEKYKQSSVAALKTALEIYHPIK